MSEPATSFLVGKRDGGKRLDRFLGEKIPGLSRTRIQQAIRERVTLSWGAAARPSTTVRAGGEVHIAYRELHETLLEIEIPVIARGTGWLCVDKPAGVPVHPVNKVLENSLIRILRRQEGDPALRLTHRLDAETTGALVVAVDAQRARHLSRSFYDDRVHKEYVAWVAGEVDAERGQVDLPIGDHPDSEVYVRLLAREGLDKPAATRWAVERRESGRTLLRLFPKSGRRHQLRVHLEAIGHPILGDPLYGRPDEFYLARVRGEPDPRIEEQGPRRLLLHCAKMAFPDPNGEGIIEVEAALPEDMTLLFHSGDAMYPQTATPESS
jgi:23S rRNA pseudouridine1911/1915/1917 synthase